MKLRFKNKEERTKRAIYLKYVLFSFFFFLYSLQSFSQDSIPIAKDLTEEKELNFQHFFFKALSEKSIGNYQKSIENLESCNQILSNEVSVFYEFSKNYFLLNNNLLAKEYINRALKKDSKNIWMLKHLVKIYVKDRNYASAIETQNKVIAINPKGKIYLARLYLQNRDYKKANALMDVLEQENGLPRSLKRLKNSLETQKKTTLVDEKQHDSSTLIKQFKTDKSYTILKEILKKSIKNPVNLLKYSEEGILLFPAQPFVYLTNGKALNYQKNYKKALTILQNGIDFVIEDKMEADFYIEMAKAYKGLGNEKDEKKYRQKSKKLKN